MEVGAGSLQNLEVAGAESGSGSSSAARSRSREKGYRTVLPRD